MLEEICKALAEETNIRENLIELKKSIKNQDALKEWKEYHATHPVLYAFLSSEDAKIRKNAALILGETNESGAAKALFEAYQRENTRFVKSSYLTAMNGLDIEIYQDAFGKRYKELLAEVPAESEKKHRTEELHALDKLLGGLNQNKKHRFTGYEEEVEVLLTTNPAYREITAEARVGGMLSGKAGVVNMHIGDGTDGLKYLREITAKGELPKTQVIPTHVNRNKHLFADAIDWAKSGGLMDFTSSIAPKDDDDPVVKTSKGIRQALDAGVPLRQISVSSDGNGSMPIFDDNGNNIGVGVANEDSLLKEFRDLVQEEALSLSDALTVFTSNVAQNTKLYPKKGCLAEGSDADILLLDDKLQLNATFARGQQMVKDGKAIVFGTFEEH